MRGANRKQIKVLLAVAGIAVGVLAFWFILQHAEQRFTRQQTAGAKEREEEPEPVLEVQGKVKLNGTTYTYDHEIESWLFIGTDASGDEEASGEDYHGAMADFLLLVVFDKTDQTYRFLQLNRDTITDITLLQPDGDDSASADIQLCTAHWYGGNSEQSCENTVDAVSRMLGKIPIEGYYSMNMEEIAALNHAVGGVEVTINSDFSKVDPTMEEGETILLSDEQAYTFVHDRYDVSDETNEERMERQKQYMKALFSKVQEKSKEDPGFLNRVYQQMEEKAVSTVSGGDLSRLLKQVQDGENQGILQIEGETKTGQALGDGIDHAEFYPDKKSVEAVMKELYQLKEQEK